MLELSSVSKSFGGLHVLHDVSLSVPEGSIFGLIGPNEYGFDRGVEILTMAILGGIGGLAGPVLGSFIITVLPEMLRGFADFRLVINGVILVVIVLFLPQGIWDPARFKRWMRQGGKRHA